MISVVTTLMYLIFLVNVTNNTNYYPYNITIAFILQAMLCFELAEIGERNELIFTLTFYCK